MMIEDDDVSDEVAAILRDDGITVLTSSMPVRVEAADGGRLRLTVRTQDGERQFEGSHLLSAIGRIPNTDALTPEAAGIRLNDRGFIEVDEYLETSVPGVYAMGDVKGGPAFTHLSYDDYRILRANLVRHEKESTRDRIVPYTMFIDPQLGRAGLTEREARAQGRAIRVAKLPMSAVIRAIETGETRGFMKAVVDSGQRANPGLRGPWQRRRRDHEHHPGRHAGQAHIHRHGRRDLHAPAPGRRPQHPLRDVRRLTT